MSKTAVLVLLLSFASTSLALRTQHIGAAASRSQHVSGVVRSRHVGVSRPARLGVLRSSSVSCAAPAEEELIFGVPAEVARPIGVILAGQFVLYIGVGAIIPTLPLYAKAIGLSSALGGVIISAPALALLLLARPAGGFADQARKPAMVGGLGLVAVADLGTSVAGSLATIVIARLGLGAGRASCPHLLTLLVHTPPSLHHTDRVYC